MKKNPLAKPAFSLSVVLLFFLLSLFGAASDATASVAATSPSAAPLPSNPSFACLGHLQASTFTISGISAGACMALQFQYAWSSIVKGAGIIASTPYMCAQGTLAGAEGCMNAGYVVIPDALFLEAQNFALLGLIDPLENLKNQTVFLLSGLLDTVVPQVNMENVASMYQLSSVSKMTRYFNLPAEHSWVTDKYGNDCSFLGTPYVNNCGLDFAGNFLEASFRDFGVKWNGTKGALQVENLFSFDQTQFGANPLTNSLAQTGYMYVPSACQQSESVCHLHLNLHGCLQDAETVGTDYVLSTELNEWAESNQIVVVYPQAVANLVLINPNACFDWWGYAGEDYAQKSGPQITVLRSMISSFGGF